MLPATAFSAIALCLAVVVFAIALLVGRTQHRGSPMEHGSLFLIFSLTTCAIIAARQWSGIPAGWQYFTFAIFWEEGQKLIASRKAEIRAVAVGLLFASAELAVAKANLIFPTPDYLDNITSQNLVLASFLMFPAVGLHALTGAIYGRMMVRPAVVPLSICVVIHLCFNLLLAPALQAIVE